MDYSKLVKKISKYIGGKENVISVVHCVTRLRFKLKDEELANTDVIKNLEGVMTVIQSGGQYQVVVGEDNVKPVYEAILEELEMTQVEEYESLFSRFVSLLSSLFMPILGVLAASGMLKGLLVIATTNGILSASDGTYEILSAAADAMFYFLPIMLGFSAGKVFKANPYLAATIGATLVYPSIVSAYDVGTSLTFLRITVELMNYTSSLIPIVIAVWILSNVEKQLKKIIPSTIEMFFVPLLSLVIIVPLTLIVVGPISTYASQGVADAMMALHNISPLVSGFVLAGLWQCLVLFGLHWAFIPIFLNNIAIQGFDPINAIVYCTIFAQTGASLAVALKTKSPKMKTLAYSATISGFLGITEPIIYGVTLPLKKPFIMGLIGAAFGGAIAGSSGAKMFGGLAQGGVFGIPLFISSEGLNRSFIGFVASLGVAFIISLILTLLFGVPKEETNK
ncbi:PTS transporter subunit EIIC [uncultured Clostridium sp.]|uniref:PTS transporter subunit EIIC n=1 Tax=uncultured Clostridium sp. TaxID=59620 RepID=UPI0028EB4F82|nr:PTS transporter subunit EIIC [uncultured Clostridium sp.]